jgi:CelD/BcsL family acetyltransferase involved in cellulose biosynthesis
VRGEPARLTLELRADLELCPSDQTAYDAIIASRPNAGVFLSRAWLSGFFAEPPQATQPTLALFRHEGRLCAIAPVGIRRTMTHVHVGLLGGGFGSDRVDLIALRGFESIASDTFVDWIRDAFGDRAVIVELRDVPAESALWGAVHRASSEGTFRHALQPREVHTLPYLDAADPMLAGADGSPMDVNSRSLAKHRRWVERRADLQIELLTTAEEVRGAFETLAAFLHARWGRSAEGSVLDNPRARRFHERVLPLMLAEERLRMIRISADRRVVAVFYGLATGRWWGYYLAGYDREWAGRVRLGLITLDAARETAFRSGAAEFDFLKGADRMKYFWPVRERATLDADLYSERSGAQFRRGTRATRDAAAAFAKSARDLLSKNGKGMHPAVR